MDLPNEMLMTILDFCQYIPTLRLVCKKWKQMVHKRFIDSPRSITFDEYLAMTPKYRCVSSILYQRAIDCGLNLTLSNVCDITRSRIDLYSSVMAHHRALSPRVHPHHRYGPVLVEIVVRVVAVVEEQMKEELIVTKKKERVRRRKDRMTDHSYQNRKVPQKYPKRTDTRQNMKLNRRMHM